MPHKNPEQPEEGHEEEKAQVEAEMKQNEAVAEMHAERQTAKDEEVKMMEELAAEDAETKGPHLNVQSPDAQANSNNEPPQGEKAEGETEESAELEKTQNDAQFQSPEPGEDLKYVDTGTNAVFDAQVNRTLPTTLPGRYGEQAEPNPNGAV